MENEFSLLELRLIQSMLTKKSDEEIAEIIGRPVAEVSSYTTLFVRGKEIITRQQVIDANKKKKKEKFEKKEAARKQKEWDEHTDIILKRQKVKSARAKIKKNDEPSFATRSTNYATKTLVRIDRKTSVYVDSGTDVELFRRQFLERMHKSHNNPTAHSNITPVKKFKPLK